MNTNESYLRPILRVALAWLACALPAGAVQVEERTLATTIDAVVLHPGSARVHRTSAALSSAGRYLVAGLPGTLDPEHVRVRCAGGHVLSVDVRERVQRAAPGKRLEELQLAIAEKREKLSIANDEQGVLQRMERFLAALFAAEPPSTKASKPAQAVSAAEARERWSGANELLGQQLASNLARQREVRWGIEALARELSNLESELGRFDQSDGVRMYDLAIEVDVRPELESRLELEYYVSGCGWVPEYDLRTAGDARRVTLSHRARVVQRSGEDWVGVDLSLSTASPTRGAQGPEPVARWIELAPRERVRATLGLDFRALGDDDGGDGYLSRLEGLGYVGDAPAEPAPFASVESAGLSLVYHLAGTESLESRPESKVVLVGEDTLDVTPEHYCAPALEETVWLRGRAKNTSPWTLLPGPASVFFGDDFLGKALMGTVQRGEELTLHLGAVPSLRVERIDTKDETEGPGFLGSKRTRTRAWTIRAQNHGARVCEPDGSVVLLVRDAIPRSNDDRVDVELSESRPAPSEDPRWIGERNELGLYTWSLRVPRDGEAALTYEVEIDYPKKLQLWIR